VTTERTELEWIYEPADLFEAQYQHVGVDYDLLIDAGRAVATLRVPQEPVSPDVEEHVRAGIDSVFLVRQLQIRRKYSLEGPRTYQHSGRVKNVSIRIGSAMEMSTAGHVDLVMTDMKGKTVRDSRLERIAEDSAVLDSVAPKLVRSPTLRGLVESYSRSVTDPNNELVHLYEIRDGLSRHYGGEQSARDALGISKGKWRRLGVLANVEPLEQGRHRGKHLGGRRAATEGELNEARQLALRWIMTFAQAVWSPAKNGLEPIAYSVRSCNAPASRSGSCPALDVQRIVFSDAAIVKKFAASFLMCFLSMSR
jgi:hypothetical protein